MYSHRVYIRLPWTLRAAIPFEIVAFFFRGTPLDSSAMAMTATVVPTFGSHLCRRARRFVSSCIRMHELFYFQASAAKQQSRKMSEL